MGSVPTGTGIMVMANRNVHVFGNRLSGNGTVHVIVAAYDAHESFAFPVGSALIKTFAHPAADRPGGLKLVETRVLLHHEKGWQAWAYVWNDEQTDAELKIAGAKIPMTVETPEGGVEDFIYAVPNKNQCKRCHAIGGEVAPIGPKARNLNHVFAYPEGPQNQLMRWANAGFLAGLPDLASVSSVPDWLDENAPLGARARAWLDINCAHCHRAEGPASNSGLSLARDEHDPVALGIGKRPVAAGRGAATSPSTSCRAIPTRRSFSTAWRARSPAS
ncbi:MAG: hypothetical protein H5U13_06390 [Parvibaculum sp.]|nr:hypothetical protein [Parvibaculum sp.]